MRGRSGTERGRAVQREWLFQEAQARFGEVFRRAREQGPQCVRKRGGKAVVVVSAEEFARLSGGEGRKKSLIEFLRESPLCGSGIDLRRERVLPRKIDL